MHPHTTTQPHGHDSRGSPLLIAITLYPSGQQTRYGPMRSHTYSLLHARAKRLGHVCGPWSESVASELQRCSRAGAFPAVVLAWGTAAADRHADALTAHPGTLSGWAESLEARP